MAEGSASAPSPREQVAEILGGVSGTGSFSARRAASPEDLHIEVYGVRRLQFPVPDAQARLLRAVARRQDEAELAWIDAHLRTSGGTSD